MIRTERFASRASTWLALVGVAIGLGNVWRFPYMMGRHGGSAFLLLYLALILLFAIPLLSAEFALGRATRKGVVDTYRAALGRRTGSVLGLVLAGSILIADSYYMVVIGNIAYTAWFGATVGFDGAQVPLLAAGLGNGLLQYGCALGILAAGSAVLIGGVNRGIELASRACVPLFGLIVLFLIGYVLTLPGIGARVGEFLAPDFSAIGIDDVFAALGQAFFSVGVGGTFMVVYGNYLKDDARLPAMAVATTLGDTAAALMAALFIIPAILYFGLDMAQGPGLIFSTFPRLFDLMPAGRLVGTLFLFAFTLMAFLSAIAGLEVCVSALRDLSRDRIGRTAAVLVVGAFEAALIWPSAHSPSLIGTLDLIFGSGMQVFGAIVAVVAIMFCLGRGVALAQIFDGRDNAWTRAYLLWLRWIVPAALIVVLAMYLVDVL